MIFERYFDKKISFFVFISILTILCFFNALFMDFVWDDIVHLDKFKFILKNFSDLLDFFKSTNIVGQPFYYRPLMLISYGLNYLLYNTNSFGYHLTSLIIHILNVFLVFLITEKILNKNVALLSSIIFAIHPVHAEPVVWISARADVLSALFLFASFYFYLKLLDEGKYKYFGATIFFYALTILTKETTIVLPIIFLIYPFFKNDKFKKNIYITFLFTLLLSIGYIIVRINIVNSLWGTDYFPFQSKIATIPLVILSYFKLFFYPFDLRLLYNEPKILSEPNLHSFISWGVLFLFILFIFTLYKRERLIAFFLVFYLLFLLPVSGIATFIRVSLIADRYLYLPSYGLIVFCSYYFLKLYEVFKSEKAKKYLEKLFFVYLLILFLLTVFRNFHWSDQFNFLSKMIKDKPDYYGAYIHLGAYYLSIKRFNEAEEAFKTALKYTGDEDRHIVMNNFCALYLEKGDYVKAEKYCLESIELNKEYSLSYNNLVSIYLETGDLNKSYILIQEAIKYNKKNPDFYNKASYVALLLGHIDEAIMYIDKAIELDPKNEMFRRNKEIILEFGFSSKVQNVVEKP